jgi:hypothetical protein
MYFLGFLLYFSTLSAVIIQNDLHRSETMINLQEDSRLFLQEREVIMQFKCLLSQKEYDLEQIPAEMPGLELNGNAAYYMLEGPQMEWIQIDFDTETRQIIDYHCVLEP